MSLARGRGATGPGGAGSGSPRLARGLLVSGAAEVATLAGGLRRGPSQDEPAIAPPGTTVACLDGLIVAVAPEPEARERLAAALEEVGASPDGWQLVDASGGTVTPGLVDPHTHLLFAGSRENEVVLRQRGAGYLEILAAGGGILATVAATRRASDAELLAHGRRWLGEMLLHGATTVEAKSGYGLETATELRLLAIAGRLAAEGPIDVIPTFLGAHAVPAEVRASRPDAASATEAYVRAVIGEQLPAVAAQGIARSVDVFCEAGVFSPDQARRILRAARKLGLEIRLHADELVPSGGAELAAELGALSADHLGCPSSEGIAALAAAAAGGAAFGATAASGAAGSPRPVVAVILPTVPWFLGLDAREPARDLVTAGVPLAIGTDFNPGTSPVPSLPLAMSVAMLRLGLTPSEVLAATTVNAAAALGLADRGSLEPGRRADLVVWDVPTHAQIPYWAGAGLVRVVIAGGKQVVAGGRVIEGDRATVGG